MTRGRGSGMKGGFRFGLPLVLAAAIVLLTGTPAAGAKRAETVPMTASQADAILAELRAIRALLEQQAAKGGPAPGTPAPSVARLPWADRPSLGNPDAEVIVVEYTDYACPYCQRFHESTWPALKRDFVDTGLVRWTVRDLPLPMHPDARGAAQAAHCAGEQGSFWEMRSRLFANRTTLGREMLERLAENEGLGRGPFRDCLDSGRHLDAIDADAGTAAQARITGTPTFVVGRRSGDQIEGRLVVGAQSAAVFDGAIRLALAGAARDGAPATPPAPP